MRSETLILRLGYGALLAQPELTVFSVGPSSLMFRTPISALLTGTAGPHRLGWTSGQWCGIFSSRHSPWQNLAGIVGIVVELLCRCLRCDLTMHSCVHSESSLLLASPPLRLTSPTDGCQLPTLKCSIGAIQSRCRAGGVVRALSQEEVLEKEAPSPGLCLWHWFAPRATCIPTPVVKA